MTGFGCLYCDFTGSEHDVALSHSLTHGKRASPPTAASILARSYRKRYQETEPSARDIPLSAFWQRGGKNKISEGHCLLCEVDIAPYTKDNLIQHLCQNHPPIIVDADSAALSDRHARPPLSKLPIDISQPPEDTEEPQPLDIDRQEGSSCKDDDEDDDEDVDRDEKEEEGDDIAGASSNEQKTALAPDTAMEEMGESGSPPMLACEHDSALLHKFMSCVKKTSIRNVENAFQMHEERVSSGKTYRVNRNLPLDAKLDSKEVVCAVLTDRGWQCEVPQCGAILNTTFITDLHLEAHGATTLTNWYCGEPTCYTGSEKVFNDKDFEDHLTTEHMGSSYSRAAARRVPRLEVLVNSLQKRLGFIRIPVKPQPLPDIRDERIEAPTTSANKRRQEQAHSDWMVTLPDEEMWSKAETGSTESTQNDLIEREEHAWARVARDLLEVEEESATDRGCDSRMRSEDKRQDAEFREHCFGRYMFLSSPKGMPPSVTAPNYLVELLTGLIHMHEDDAKRYIKTYLPELSASQSCTVFRLQRLSQLLQLVAELLLSSYCRRHETFVAGL